MKTSTLLLLSLLFMSCEQDLLLPKNASAENSTARNNSEISARISYQEALEIAEHGISMFESVSASRSTTSIRTIDSKKVRYFIASATRNTNRPDTLMYVFNAWVADGFRIETYIGRTWKSIPGTEMWILDREEKDIRNYIHYNWGWDGCNNGYFNSSVFDVSAPHELDEGCFNAGTGNFSKAQTIVDISPNL